MQAPAAVSAALTAPILLQLWTENFDSAYPMLDLINTLINGRKAACRGVAGNAQGAGKQLPSKVRENALPHRRREFCGLVTRNDENRTTRTFDYALRGASQKQPP